MKIILPTLLLLANFYTTTLAAQNGTDIESASLAVERMLDQNGKEGILSFIDKYMANADDREALVEKIIEIRKELEGLRDGIGLDLDDDGAILSLASEGIEKRLRIQYDQSSQQVTNLFILAPEERIAFENVDSAIQFMIENDMSGLLYFKTKGNGAITKPFGMANEKLGVANSRTTIFAIGSRPIDFTTAAILLLDQEGQLSLDDTIDKHLIDVPLDKKSMTIKHLMTGESGLPDFFDIEGDWDPDLQWISREEAIRRMMNQTLLFKPGKGNSHSHGAFGLLAAIVEIKSGISYMEFLNENFFEPANMIRTGEYGDKKDLQVEDFAVGGGPQFVGLPNIAPNWGPTSWLVKGSGGMYSTLDDLLKFYSLVRNGNVLDQKHARYFKSPTADVDGSMRGFELFSVFNPSAGELFLFLNNPGEEGLRRKVFRALEEMLDY